jgi:hypothetical protein
MEQVDWLSLGFACGVCALESIIDGEEKPLSAAEKDAAQRMRELCEKYIELFDKLQEGDAE